MRRFEGQGAGETSRWGSVLCGLDKRQALFVRGCYAWFYDEALKKRSEAGCPGVIYTGNPGIGKSAWLNYALVRFLQDDYVVVLERAQESDYLVFREGSCVRQKHSRPDLDDLPDKAVYLYDPDESNSCPLKSNVFTIIASSPQEKHYKALKKMGAGRYYFPCWLLEELQCARPEMDTSLLVDRWHKWGGIPRFVFSQEQQCELLEVDLQKAITGLNLSLVFTYMKTPEISEEDQKMISHILVQYRVLESEAPYQRVELDFASDWIGERIVETEARRDYQNLISHYEKVRRSEWQGAYSGHLWEHMCHAIVPLGTKEGFRLEPLAQNKTQNRRIVKSGLVVKKGKLEDMMTLLEEGCYFQPTASNFPVIDAAVMAGKDVFGFQMTVGSSHAPKAHEALKLLNAIPAGKMLHLVWVVDPVKEHHIKTAQTFQQSKKAAKMVDTSQMAKLHALPQWLLKLSFPQENPYVKK